jgi:hypothetical protein
MILASGSRRPGEAAIDFVVLADRNRACAWRDDVALSEHAAARMHRQRYVDRILGSRCSQTIRADSFVNEAS